MPGVILDATAILAVVLTEAGAEWVAPHLRSARVSALSWSMVLSSLLERGVPVAQAVADLRRIRLAIVPFDEEHAAIAANLRPTSSDFQLSLADRACLALGQTMRRPVLTTHLHWAGLYPHLQIECIR